MNKIEKQKKMLIQFSTIVLILSCLVIIGAVLLIVFGGKNIGDGKNTAGIIELVFGCIAFVASFVGIIWGITFIWTGNVLKATNGSIKDENLCKGTVNMIKCQKCGTELPSKDAKCSKCNPEEEK